MTLQNQILSALEAQPELHTLDLATQLSQKEGSIILHLPSKFISFFTGDIESLLAEIHSWGKVVTIIEKGGSLFEITGVFPKGKNAYGYFNLNLNKDPNIALSAHLKLSTVKHIVLVTKPFRGKESFAIAFITETEDVLFKIYLARDENHQLYPEQIKKFNQLKNKDFLCQNANND